MKELLVSDTFELVKEWNELQRKHRDLEYEMAKFARRVRQRFQTGAVGDRGFKDWCIVNLKMEESESETMVSLAISGLVFANGAELKKAGGVKQFVLIDEASPQEQESVMRTAKAQNLTMATVWRRRTAGQVPRPTSTPSADARRFAEYIAKMIPNPPPPIREALARYIKSEIKRAAA